MAGTAELAKACSVPSSIVPSVGEYPEQRAHGGLGAAVALVSSCNVHHLFPWVFSPSFLKNCYYCFTVFQLLNCFYLSPQDLFAFLRMLLTP